ncbi:hypothetical protein M9H77_12209 [Catharanthus roseus]|uniref:Uncharacterized protein n=1 Tax=Catharanthus roseus TaxID=4058 RepID=A0ACC0BGT1_CATRO|nr:hypothetical protein M9H77_12209 [Catharanthus roseus]
MDPNDPDLYIHDDRTLKVARGVYQIKECVKGEVTCRSQGFLRGDLSDDQVNEHQRASIPVAYRGGRRVDTACKSVSLEKDREETSLWRLKIAPQRVSHVTSRSHQSFGRCSQRRRSNDISRLGQICVDILALEPTISPDRFLSSGLGLQDKSGSDTGGG